MKKIMMILLVIFLGFTLIQCRADEEVFSGKEAETLMAKYGLNDMLSFDWTHYSLVRRDNNKMSENHKFYESLDSNYQHIDLIHKDYSEQESLSFIIFDAKAWNMNASKATNDDISLLPPILLFDHNYVISIDPYDYDVNKSGYDEVIEQLQVFNFYEKYESDHKINELITVESDYIIYDLDIEKINVSWRSILGDPIRTTGTYVLEYNSDGVWQEVYSGQTTIGEVIDIQHSTFGCDFKNLGHYRLGIEYERLKLYGLELNEKENYMVYTSFDVGEKAVKRYEDKGLEGIRLVTEHATYPKDTLLIKCKWINELDDSFTYGNMFALEKYDGYEWVNVDFGDIAFTCEGFTLGPNSEAWHIYDMSWILSSLDKGQYRIKTDIIRDTLDGIDFGAGNYPVYDIYTEFEIKGEDE